MLQTFDFDAPARRFNVLCIGRLRIGWWTVPLRQFRAILKGGEQVRIWSTR